ncbi:hypothetical protein [Terasakiella sp.]|uniref:hypothetical protein n=1 Tax=Terasakiella sp. TaxID=2034861 RepID=UPI003AA92ACB
MEYQSRSPRVVAAHFFAQYGYDYALQQVSTNLGCGQDELFWKNVVDILEELREDDRQGQHPCAALPPRKQKPVMANKPARSHQ